MVTSVFSFTLLLLAYQLCPLQIMLWWTDDDDDGKLTANEKKTAEWQWNRV